MTYEESMARINTQRNKEFITSVNTQGMWKLWRTPIHKDIKNISRTLILKDI